MLDVKFIEYLSGRSKLWGLSIRK